MISLTKQLDYFSTFQIMNICQNTLIFGDIRFKFTNPVTLFVKKCKHMMSIVLRKLGN